LVSSNKENIHWKEGLSVKETTRGKEYTTEQGLHLAFELEEGKWKLAFGLGLGHNPRQRVIEVRDVKALEREVRLAKQRFGMPETAPVQRCYEAG
jgi:hypothetical protein